LVAGGYSNYYGTGNMELAEIYNPATGTWTQTGSLGLPRRDHTATLLPNGTVLVAGGQVYFNSLVAEIYKGHPGNGEVGV